MSESQKLEGLLAKGKWRYIVLHGVLGWGIITALLYSTLMFWINSTTSLQSIAINLLLFPVTGFFWGLFSWRIINRRRQTLSQSSGHQK